MNLLFNLLFIVLLSIFTPKAAWSLGTDHFYRGKGDLKNSYRLILNPSGSIKNPLIILTGMEDLPENWLEISKRALAVGYRSITIIELRGQGRSERVLSGGQRLVHVHEFSDYVFDFLAALQDLQTKMESPTAPAHLIAHSTGAAVLLLALPELNKVSPHLSPGKLSLWTPFFKPRMPGWIDNSLVRGVLKPISQLSLKLGYPIIARQFRSQPAAENHLTSDLGKYMEQDQLKRKLDLQSSGLTLHWALESFTAAEKVRREWPELLKVPCLIWKAEDEHIVSNEWSMPSPLVKTIMVEGARHALHLEKEDVLKRVTQATFEFFASEQSTNNH